MFCFYYLNNSHEFFLNASDLVLPIAIVYVGGVVSWPKCVLPKSVTSHEYEGYVCVCLYNSCIYTCI